MNYKFQKKPLLRQGALSGILAHRCRFLQMLVYHLQASAQTVLTSKQIIVNIQHTPMSLPLLCTQRMGRESIMLKFSKYSATDASKFSNFDMIITSSLSVVSIVPYF